MARKSAKEMPMRASGMRSSYEWNSKENPGWFKRKDLKYNKMDVLYPRNKVQLR